MPDYVTIKTLSPKATLHFSKLFEEADGRMRKRIADIADEGEAADMCNDLAELHSLQNHVARGNISELTLKEYKILTRVLVQGIADIGEKLQGNPNEDEESDLSNDLGFLAAVLSDLKKANAT